LKDNFNPNKNKFIIKAKSKLFKISKLYSSTLNNKAKKTKEKILNKNLEKLDKIIELKLIMEKIQ
jgi:hypothetical protein